MKRSGCGDAAGFFCVSASQSQRREGGPQPPFLRRKGVTMRKTIDMIIGTHCIEQNCALLHSDRDFDPMVEHLGLRIA
jgi:predicted nucleic acid-binding protein